MDDKTFEALRQLAEKLGTTGEHLWGVLLRQAPITAAVHLATWVAFVVMSAVLTRRSYTAWMASGRKPYYRKEGLFVATVGCGVAVFVSVIAGLNGAPDVVAGFLNPEYVALHDVLRALGK